MTAYHLIQWGCTPNWDKADPIIILNDERPGLAHVLAQTLADFEDPEGETKNEARITKDNIYNNATYVWPQARMFTDSIPEQPYRPATIQDLKNVSLLLEQLLGEYEWQQENR